MLKIFLVEDEFVVREGIKKNIDWSANGYDFCGEASDGELALPMIQKLKPDIVITDIKMPFMDGLELSRLIKKEFPWMEIIILSGYEDFKYAKEGIKIGVAEYLTKPISGNELLEEVEALAEKIEEKRREREISEQYQKEMQENFLQERKNLFQYLVTGSRTVPELLDLAGRLRIDLTSMYYNIVLIMTQSMNHAQEEYSNSLIEIEQKLNEIDDETHILMFDRNLEGKALLFKADSAEELEQIQHDYLNRMKDILIQYSHVRYFGGIGVPVNRLTELPVSFEKASHVFAHRYLVRESMVIHYVELEQGSTPENKDFDISSVDPKQMDRHKVLDFLKLGEPAETKYFVEEFFKDFGKNALESNMFRQYLAMDTYFCVAEFAESLLFSKEEIEPFDIASGAMQSSEGTMRYIERIIEKALDLREKSASNRYGDIVDEVMQYINKNYADEDLSLNLLASHVNFSPNHLSMIFSQQTGQTFIKYLTDFRMNKAKELLRCTGKRSSIICSEVGYKDPHYFSYLFKKTQGMTPTQYREGK